MKIVDHGKWELYEPNPLPDELLISTMFCRRVGDKVDWYKYQKNFDPKTVKCTVYGDVIQAVYRDQSALFPAGARVIEIFEFDDPKPHNQFAKKKYDAETNTIV